jgi:hypothetical protein
MDGMAIYCQLALMNFVLASQFTKEKNMTRSCIERIIRLCVSTVAYPFHFTTKLRFCSRTSAGGQKILGQEIHSQKQLQEDTA